MKKYVLLALALIMTLSFAACGEALDDAGSGDVPGSGDASGYVPEPGDAIFGTVSKINLEVLLGEWEGIWTNETGTHVSSLSIYKEGEEYKAYTEAITEAGETLSWVRSWTARPDGTISTSEHTWVNIPGDIDVHNLADLSVFFSFDGTLLASISGDGTVRGQYERKPS
jgi:hypothetical protein